MHLQSEADQGDIDALVTLASLPELPPLAAHVWRYFIDLSRTRGGTGFGPAPISRHDIHAWEADEAQVLEPWERRALLAIDVAYLNSVANTMNAKEG